MVASARMKWFALALLCVTQFVVVLDIAIVNVALPSIQEDLGFSQENLQWVISAYALVFGGFLLLGGRLADILGRRRVFMAGLVIFSVGSLLCGLAWSETSLIAARALQGLGAATITPSALSILTTTFREGRERNIALGAWGAVGGFGAAAGVLMGGILTDSSRGSGSSSSTFPIGIAASRSRRSCSPRAGMRTARATTSPVPSSSRAGSSSSSSGSRRATAGAGRSAKTIGAFAPSAVLLARLRALGAAADGPARSLLHLPPADADGGERGRLHHGHGAVLDVPDADALHAAGAGLLGDEDRRRLPRRRGHCGHLG